MKKKIIIFINIFIILNLSYSCHAFKYTLYWNPKEIQLITPKSKTKPKNKPPVTNKKNKLLSNFDYISKAFTKNSSLKIDNNNKIIDFTIKKDPLKKSISFLEVKIDEKKCAEIRSAGIPHVQLKLSSIKAESNKKIILVPHKKTGIIITDSSLCRLFS